ncbi:pVII [Bat mastadenovirus WIV12]|uniref:PVII n=1 Tax=Bat mastadenovirus WIV12 TaxID=1788434 RepID=A0A1B0UI03_9ADEN|nr:pVII [Bat mastadenovirus WIV12]AMB43153.1 pVII [Bat mastadenovirus WIV12]
MAILISPSDNTGWGIGARKMYGGLLGGAREYSEETPVLVRQYYRARWGSKTRHGRPVIHRRVEVEPEPDENEPRRSLRLRRKGRRPIITRAVVARKKRRRR